MASGSASGFKPPRDACVNWRFRSTNPGVKWYAVADRCRFPMSRLPNFFLAGAPKAGTTSIYHYLDQHPGIFMSAIKEPHYFADEIREENMDPGTRRDIAAANPELRLFLAGEMREKR